MDKCAKCHAVGMLGREWQLLPASQKRRYLIQAFKNAVHFWHFAEGGALRPRQGEQGRKAQGMCGEQQMVWSDWVVE